MEFKVMKRIKDMTREELLELYQHNKHFQEKAFERAVDTAYFWVEEYLSGLPRNAADYEFGVYTHCYFKIKKPEETFIWLHDAQEKYCLLSDEDNTWLEMAHSLYHKYYYGDIEEDEEEMLFDELIPAIEKAVCDFLKSEYEQFEDGENVFEYVYENLWGLYDGDAYTIRGEWAIYETVTHKYI